MVSASNNLDFSGLVVVLCADWHSGHSNSCSLGEALEEKQTNEENDHVFKRTSIN